MSVSRFGLVAAAEMGDCAVQALYEPGDSFEQLVEQRRQRFGTCIGHRVRHVPVDYDGAKAEGVRRDLAGGLVVDGDDDAESAERADLRKGLCGFPVAQVDAALGEEVEQRGLGGSGTD